MSWDDRYAEDGFLFGTEPAAFLVDQKAYLTRGLTALAIGDGEGRNSVYMAEQGLEVTAMDASEVGLEKARMLAAVRSARVRYHLGDVADWDWDAKEYDLVVAIFIQFAGPDLRREVFAGMKRALKPGGRLLLHGYRPEQVVLGTGGPPHIENMYTEEILREAFGDMKIERLVSYEAEIDEGPGHSGLSALIDLVARKI